MRQENRAVWTVVDLWIGIFIYFIIFEGIGLIFVEKRIPYTLGLLLGCVTGAFLAWNMYVSLDQALDLPQDDALKFTKKRVWLRWLVMLVMAFAGMRLTFLSFPAVITGILGLKISAFLQPYTNLYITKILRKGR